MLDDVLQGVSDLINGVSDFLVGTNNKPEHAKTTLERTEEFLNQREKEYAQSPAFSVESEPAREKRARREREKLLFYKAQEQMLCGTIQECGSVSEEKMPSLDKDFYKDTRKQRKTDKITGEWRGNLDWNNFTWTYFVESSIEMEMISDECKYAKFLQMDDLDELSEYARNNEAIAIAKIGEMHALGIGVKKNPISAYNCFKKAADMGEPFSLLVLGEYYKNLEDYDSSLYYYSRAIKNGAVIVYHLNDSHMGVEKYKELADLTGNSYFQCDYAKKLSFSPNITSNDVFKEMASYYIKAAKQGNYEAMKRLTKLYKEGKVTLNDDFNDWVFENHEALIDCAINNTALEIEVPKEYCSKLERLFSTPGKEMKYVDGQFVESKKEEDKYTKMTMEELIDLQKQQDAKAIMELADRYYYGTGVEEDLDKCFELTYEAALLKDSYGEYSLAHAYQYEEGVNKDISKAIAWYARAIFHRNEDAFINLIEIDHDLLMICGKYASDYGIYNKAYGFVLEFNGIKNPPIDSSAFCALVCLAVKGNSNAYNMLGVFFENRTGLKYRDYEKAFKNYKIAAEMGNQYGLYNLGKCYENGIGTAKNSQMAAKCYKEAADNGHNAAADSYDRLYVAGKVGNIKTTIIEHKDISGFVCNITTCIDNGNFADAAHNMRNVLECIVEFFTAQYASQCINDTIFNKLVALEKTGMIDRHYIDIMHQIRKLGNRGAHVGETPVDEGEIKMQIEPLNDLIDFYNSFD